MQKISFAGCFGISPAISVQFTLEMHVAVQNHEKFSKTLYFGGSKSLRSSMLTFLRSSLPALAMICSMSVPICNHFLV